jgi:CRP-like cAMP-binding protein
MAETGEELMSSRWFAGQPARLRERLLRQARVSDVAPGQWIYGTGDALNGLYGVLDGVVHLLVTLPDGETRLMDIVQSGQLFGQPARFGGGPRLLTALAGAPSRLLFVPDHALAEIARNEPEVWRNFAALLYNQLAGGLLLAAYCMHLTPRRLVAARLAALAAGHDAVPVTQAQLGEMTGLSRKTVNQHLSTLERAGIVERHYGHIAIRDLARLQRAGGSRQ